MLSGIGLSDWLGLLREHWQDIELSRLPRLTAITMQSLKNSAFSIVERKRFDEKIRDVLIHPPLFVLGHWRSGTTHLHQLISQDSRFGFPNSYQTAFPSIFLTREAAEVRWLSHLVPRQRPMDNVELTLASPQEDEFALCAGCLRSPCMSWVLPNRREKFGRYLTFKDVSSAEVTEWKNTLLHFVKKVQWRCKAPLVLKSPPHTARIRFLLELFPEAKFVHIHRNPYRVFQSTRQLLPMMFRWHGLRKPDYSELDDWVLHQYAEMYQAFFDQQPLVPTGRFHEVSFEDLERDPLKELRGLYQALGLPDFAEVEPKVRGYVDSLVGYRKNTFSPIAPELQERIRGQWGTSFERWGFASSETKAL